MNPCKFPDTKIINNKGNITTEVFHKTFKLSVRALFAQGFKAVQAKCCNARPS